MTACEYQEKKSLNDQNGSVVTVDDHFAFFKLLCDRANEYYIVQKVCIINLNVKFVNFNVKSDYIQAKSTYDSTKHSIGILERTLDQVEERAKDALSYSVPVYENYVFPAANRLLGAYTKGIL